MKVGAKCHGIGAQSQAPLAASRLRFDHDRTHTVAGPANQCVNRIETEKSMDQHRLRICVISLTAAAVLSACGGGGGDNTTPASTPSPSSSSSSSSSSGGFTLSGTISVPETAALDSDTNDVNQVGWAANNTAVTAQTIGTPIQLLGTVNLPNTGPAGKNYSAIL